MYIFILILVFIPLTLLFPTRVVGRKNFKKGKCIVTANHRSNMDAIIVYLKANRKMHFLAKKELFEKKALGGFLKSLGCVSIDRQGTDISAMKTTLGLLKQDKTVAIFPQGTRTTSEDFDIKNGVCMFAIKAKAPIVPMYIKKKPKLFCWNTIYIGEPYELDEFYDKKLTKEVLDEASNIVTQKYNELKDKYTKRKVNNESKI